MGSYIHFFFFFFFRNMGSYILRINVCIWVGSLLLLENDQDYALRF